MNEVMYGDMDGSWWVGGALMMIIFWGLLIALGVFAVQALSRREEPRAETPLEIARRRYAAGEISREEFEQIRSDLSSPRGTPA